MSSLTVEEDQKWLPTHVQVTVLRARGVRGKSKQGTSDVYTIIQLGKEKYSTGVQEKTTEPQWREECSFELHPGVLVLDSSCPAASTELVLIVMHRAVMDVFLGQAVIQLDKVFHETRCVRNEWYKLNSKTGKKEKERGDIQVTVQFTRNNLTASMHDLVMKEKGASTFGKLKERIKSKTRSSEEDSASAGLPTGYGSLQRIRQRLPSDGGGEEDYEDDEGGEARRSKMRTFFLRGKLRKSSDTRSSTSLGSESSESSSRGGSLSPTAGISVVVSDLSNSPSNSSNLTVDNSPEHKSSSLICEFGDDDDGEISIAVPQLTVCVNGSHAYNVQPLDAGSGKPADSSGLAPRQKSLPLSVSLQNLRPDNDLLIGSVGDGRRWSFDKPCEEEKAAIAAALEKSGPMLGDEEEQSGQAAPPKSASSSSSTVESESQGKKQRRNLSSQGRSESAGKRQSQSKDESEQASAAAEEKHKGWFGSKDSHSKPSLVVSPKLELSTDPHPPPSHHHPGPPVDPDPLVSPLHHSNPFSHSQTTPPPISSCNPFFSLLQHNPFYDDMLTAKPLNPSLPPLPYLSSSRPPIAQLFPQAGNPSLTHDTPPLEDAITGTVAKSEAMAKAGERPLSLAPVEGEKPLSMTSPSPFMCAGELDPDSEWDESFEAFAAGRLQSPEDLTADCKTQQNTVGDHPLEHCNNKGETLPITDPNTKANDALHRQPCTGSALDAQKAIGQATSTYHLDTFAQFLETIPEHASFESDNIALSNSPNLDTLAETNQANSATNANDLTDTNVHPAPCHSPFVKLNSSSPDPGSSGIGSSEAEDDFLSCLSSHSDKLSASSSEEAEAQNLESNILGFQESFDSSVVKQLEPSKSEDDITDRSTDLSLVGEAQHTVIQHNDGDEEAGLNALEGSSAQQSPLLTHQQPVINASEDAVTQPPNFSSTDLLSELQPNAKESLQSDNRNGEDFSTVLNDSSVSVINTTDGTTSTTPDDKLYSTHPSLHIITSSPDVRWSSSDSPIESTGLGEQDASQRSPIPFGLFGDFLNTSHIANGPSQEFDDTLLNARASDQSSSSSFFQSLYVSTDSQDYQTCESQTCFSGSETNSTLHSANSTICNEPSDIRTPAEDASGQEDPSNACKPRDEEMNQTDQSGGSDCGAGQKTAALESSFMIADGFGLLPAASADSFMICDLINLTERGVESQHVVSGDVPSESPQAQSATLQRSQSEGTLAPAFEELLLMPSFGSDPGAIQESSSAPPGPHLPSLTSFAPCLTPQSSSSPLALCSPPPFANATASSPPSAAIAGAPKPMLQETPPPPPQQQQQAANQQTSPHPVKPLNTAILAEEKRTEGRSVLEKLKSTIHPGRSSQLSEQETERKKSVTEGAGSYYHLNHRELVALLVKREAELERQKVEFERQKLVLAKREVELRKLKPQVKDLEDYIDTLLVRIMEQKPTLLQVRSKLK
ncbi:rab11 family-interacting protein 1 isoform X1 [Anoplopoma fimbria]|uniref:rab11 family-interacting protein 1 isoform X1 n=1 Tax=Anoplopoma fimbria TaxID=229290 RepID=UPI0023EC7D04|nr:rab11 family-interacting protein 1 isoform X1 [Anoplopoma fimbria]